LLGWRAVRYRTWNWLPHQLAYHQPFDSNRYRGERPIDVIVIVADHFEPGRQPTAEAAAQLVREWCEVYEAIAGRHCGPHGRVPPHPWFYPGDYPNPACLRALSSSVFKGFGEVEFHLHHGFDSHESFAAKLRSGLEWFNRQGAMRTAEAQPQQRFGYVA